MDNVTHTLIGIGLGAAASRLRPAAKDFSHAAIWVGMLASNAPDLDVVLEPILGGGKLGYLLHHRGYTHTLLMAPFFAALSVAAANRIAGQTWRAQFKPLFVLGLFACLLHLGADSWNNYGIHPFSPFQNDWYYGDFIFIVEPLFWLSLIPFVLFELKSKAAKGVWILLGVGILGFAWISPFTPMPVPVVLTVWAGLWLVAQYFRRGLATASVAVALILSLFFVGSRQARSLLEGTLARQAPGEALLDLVTTPAPGNPFCWGAIVLSRTSEGQYKARLGTVSLAPAFTRAEVCLAPAQGTAPVSPISLPAGPDNVAWRGEFRGSLNEFEQLMSASCRFRALMRFARVPFWITGGQSTIAGDLRYDRSGDLSFAEIEVAGGDGCPPFVPPWNPPFQH